MQLRALTAGVMAAMLASTAVYAGDASPAGTTDADIIVPAPTGSLGGVSTGLLVAGAAGILAIAAIAAASGDDDDDDDSPSETN